MVYRNSIFAKGSFLIAVIKVVGIVFGLFGGQVIARLKSLFGLGTARKFPLCVGGQPEGFPCFR
jgi:hypothetical protein